MSQIETLFPRLSCQRRSGNEVIAHIITTLIPDVSFLIIEAQWPRTFDYGLLLKKIGPHTERKQLIRGSTYRKLILFLFYIVNVLSITECVQLISVYKNATCRPSFLDDDSYTCVCPAGFAGAACNEGKRCLLDI